MLTTAYILSQTFALLAYITLSATFFMKSKLKIVVFNIANSLFFLFHYFFLGASMGMIMNLIGIFRGIWYYLDEKFDSKHLFNSLIMCVAASIVCSIFAFTSWVELIALVAGLGFTYSLWQKNIGFYRWAMLACSVLWVTYNALHLSIIAIVGESFLIVIEIIAIAKYYKKDKGELITGVANKNLQNTDNAITNQN